MAIKKLDIPVFEIAYPFWKVIVWRYVRVFMAGFIASLSVDTLLIGNTDVWLSTIKSAVAGGLAALSLSLREDTPKDSMVNKIPL